MQSFVLVLSILSSHYDVIIFNLCSPNLHILISSGALILIVVYTAFLFVKGVDSEKPFLNQCEDKKFIGGLVTSAEINRRSRRWRHYCGGVDTGALLAIPCLGNVMVFKYSDAP